MPMCIYHERDGIALTYQWSGVHYYAFTLATLLEDQNMVEEFQKDCPDLTITEIPETAAMPYQIRGLTPVNRVMEHEWKFEGLNGEIVHILPGDKIGCYRE